MGGLNIFMDTNIIKKINPNMMSFELNETYKILKSFIVENDLKDIKVFIPKIVFEELLTQYIEEHRIIKEEINEEYNKLVIKSNRLNWDVQCIKEKELSNREYIQHIRKCCEGFIERESDYATIIDFPCSEKMNKIIDRAIKKKQPFFSGHYSKKEFSDAGFKDVIFLESVIEQLEKTEGDYLIISKDKTFNEINLEKEIIGKHGKIVSCDTGKEIVKYLEELLSVDDMSKHISFCKTRYYAETLENVLDCIVLENIIEINKREDNGVIFIDNISLVEIDSVQKVVAVRLSEENDFLEVLNKDTSEVMFEWVD